MKPILILQMRIAWVVLLACLAVVGQLSIQRAAAAPTATPWDAPAAQLAGQIAAIVGPGQVQLTVINRSSIPAASLASIQSLLELSLRSHGIRSGATESASLVRVTLSENTGNSLWVAEVIEGSQRQVAMVSFVRPHDSTTHEASGVLLERKVLWSSADAGDRSFRGSGLLAALEWKDALLLLAEDHISLYTHTASGWTESKRQTLIGPLDASRPVPREMRGELQIDDASSTITAYLPGWRCVSNLIAATPPAATPEPIRCTASDDPWPVTSGPAAEQKAFYNAARNYFTGVLTPGIGVELPPFYSAQFVQPASALLFMGIDGKPRLAVGGSIEPVTGGRDWGSEIAVVASSCGNTEILVSNSGEAQADSLRAYELHGNEAIAASEPLSLKGSVMAMHASSDASARSASSSATEFLAVLRIRSQNDEPEYEVDRVSALCQ